MLNAEECERARIGRMAAYDGRFFTGVRTTGVYCRPVCPVRPARACNVEFFPSAAAAEMSGYRPCLRCRPEAAPFSPAWKGSRTTANRAMRLIADGALDTRGVEALAARLGIGPRHLSRGKPNAGGEDRADPKSQASHRRDRLADDRDCAPRGLPEPTTLQCRVRGNLQAPAKRDPADAMNMARAPSGRPA